MFYQMENLKSSLFFIYVSPGNSYKMVLCIRHTLLISIIIFNYGLLRQKRNAADRIPNEVKGNGRLEGTPF